jgi:hypothetical protein
VKSEGFSVGVVRRGLVTTVTPKEVTLAARSSLLALAMPSLSTRMVAAVETR